MFVSACPLSGKIDAYPAEIQDKLRDALLNGTKSVFLGSTCFLATVHLESTGWHYQTTPPLGSKKKGFRSVAVLPVEQTHVKVYFSSRGIWTLHPTETNCAFRMVERCDVPSEIVWEWSTIANLANCRENAWISYRSDASVILEDAWNAANRLQSAQTVDIETGLAKKRVTVEPGKAFFQQRDLHTNNLRWARRSYRTKSECERKCIELKRRVSYLDGEVCSICTDAYRDTAEWPVMRLSCGHSFHACCIRQCMSHETTRCPLCRAEISIT